MGSGFIDILPLVERAHADPAEVRRPAAERELHELEKSLGAILPAELRAWLRRCAGSTAGPGGLFGVGGDEVPWVRIVDMEDAYKAWRRRLWIPVAGDGAGNYYVLDAGHPSCPGDSSNRSRTTRRSSTTPPRGFSGSSESCCSVLSNRRVGPSTSSTWRTPTRRSRPSVHGRATTVTVHGIDHSRRTRRGRTTSSSPAYRHPPGGVGDPRPQHERPEYILPVFGRALVYVT